eukprot:CAMPEP_0206018528 /NCGR_PEP_ID=MMETSP1464-20131121/27322_1 /ASSEMBLY_ACC=CAM_ASM_001124 /TAXON_ID=119497 /ORGANISM="Exanthemachrysis gayraliae, Strain RCC1523" /LENGTH=133 /DNA_ID=CAMNT_0053392405 /DNA_START=19 /DNA_END=422 /DNA_ORIENTATION=+
MKKLPDEDNGGRKTLAAVLEVDHSAAAVLAEDKQEALVIMAIFGVTGSSSLFVVRPLLEKAGIRGSWQEGPNSYRLASVAVVSPIYSLMLVTIGTISGRHRFFGRMSSRIMSRFTFFGSPIMCPPGASASRAA